MNDMIIRNRNLGLESILQTAEERAPRRLQAHPRRAVAGGTGDAPRISFKKAAGFDVETVNSRESFVELPAREAEPIARLIVLAMAIAWARYA